ncbi:MerR family transcriptional regulator [Paracoccus shanxieyensis]|uniref:MerR family transcriptional regulator n=1 Tax=Paracoccus shanxieyensis TaxID=2675752 RepID=A0A6L6ITV6_9RHOB|nr:MerR family transcriptional regulator [Paracoccus shanxieyensis]MTH63886.1 MerR family transcriptional regulator [Paracoccus shanxieyensis]MTH86602.1 MerR family transcriptional regulator [Paracoccus shanxieyensis]
MDKSPDAFRSIGEVSRLVGVAPHVLRYWETQFTQLSPVKRSDGRRYYRPEDVRLIAGLCQVMREEGMSIRGAKRLIAADRGAGLRQIGAQRLGETASADDTQRRAPAAVRLALPEPTGSETAQDTALAAVPPPARDRVDVTRATARRRKPAADEPLPLFPEIAPQTAPWILRLTRLAAMLRAHEASGQPLPPESAALRGGLYRR